MRHEGTEQLIGTSAVIAELSQEIDRIARSDAKVLITGESGVGKELVAHAIHQRSPRVARPMVAVNCAGLPETLLESELFGHVKGSFTGAYRDKQGKLEMADRGSIFLDEIGEMTLRMQGLLLRFMETGELQKVGADRIAGRVNVRVIAATNRNLRDMITEGTFREDLFYRLNVIHLVVPPLRERREDIPALIDYFMHRFTRNNGHPVKFISPDANKLLCEYSWPGNVRELENVIERLVVTGPYRVGDARNATDGNRSQQLIRAAAETRAATDGRDDLYKKLVRTASRSGPLSILSTCSARLPAATCVTWCARDSRTRVAITRLWRSCSTWSRATTSGS
jgi:transcriptional regulator with PAS, ATPase and Fis domain